MPLFDFRCGDCDAVREILAKVGEAVTCPECGGATMTKQLSSPAVIGNAKSPESNCGGSSDHVGNQAAAAKARGDSCCC